MANQHQQDLDDERVTERPRLIALPVAGVRVNLLAPVLQLRMTQRRLRMDIEIDPLELVPSDLISAHRLEQ